MMGHYEYWCALEPAPTLSIFQVDVNRIEKRHLQGIWDPWQFRILVDLIADADLRILYVWLMKMVYHFCLWSRSTFVVHIYIIIVFWLVDVCECLSWYYHLWIYDMFFVIQYVIWSNWIFDNCLSGTSCEDPVISSYIIYYSNRSWWDTPSLPGLLFFIEPGTTTLSHEVLVGLPGIGWKTGLLYLVEWGSEAFKKLDIPPPQHPAKS